MTYMLEITPAIPCPGASRGFGFVEYEEEDDAKDAIDNMDGSHFHQNDTVIR